MLCTHMHTHTHTHVLIVLAPTNTALYWARKYGYIINNEENYCDMLVVIILKLSLFSK